MAYSQYMRGGRSNTNTARRFMKNEYARLGAHRVRQSEMHAPLGNPRNPYSANAPNNGMAQYKQIENQVKGILNGYTEQERYCILNTAKVVTGSKRAVPAVIAGAIYKKKRRSKRVPGISQVTGRPTKGKLYRAPGPLPTVETIEAVVAGVLGSYARAIEAVTQHASLIADFVRSGVSKPRGPPRQPNPRLSADLLHYSHTLRAIGIEMERLHSNQHPSARNAYHTLIRVCQVVSGKSGKVHACASVANRAGVRDLVGLIRALSGMTCGGRHRARRSALPELVRAPKRVASPAVTRARKRGRIRRPPGFEDVIPMHEGFDDEEEQKNAGLPVGGLVVGGCRGQYPMRSDLASGSLVVGGGRNLSSRVSGPYGRMGLRRYGKRQRRGRGFGFNAGLGISL